MPIPFKKNQADLKEVVIQQKQVRIRVLAGELERRLKAGNILGT